MTSDELRRKSAVERYVETYLALDTQAPDEAGSDGQLASIVLNLSERIGNAPFGAIIDIGCGQGTLLNRLTQIPHFMNNDQWIYIGIDEDRFLSSIQDMARQLRINRRVEVLSLEQFYQKWPDVSGLQLVVCRNVLHELRIVDTSLLLHHVAMSIKDQDVLFIQDLMKFPESERHNACWAPQELYECFIEIGLAPQLPVVQGTRSGNAYFNMISRALIIEEISLENVQTAVKNARTRQWHIWLEIEESQNQYLLCRDELVEALDIDLQITALTRQLRDVGLLATTLPADVEKRVRVSEFTRLVENVGGKPLVSSFLVEDSVHFRERGVQLTLLEEFLRGAGKLAIVHGGAGYGKTTLVHRLLATRSYQKLVVQIDGKRIKSAWAFLESMLSQVGIRLAPEQLSVLDNMSLATIEPTIRNFLNKAGSKLILYYDNFNEILDPDGNVEDPDLLSLLCLVASKEGVKIIVSSRSEYAPRRMLEATGEVPVTVRVGRYATDQTVVNILDDYFNRSAFGLTEYPQSLLDAIDRHPLINVLAARALQLAGPNLLMDQAFISELKNRLKEDLWGRIVSESAGPAVLAAASLRLPVPMLILSNLADRDSLQSAQDGEVIYGEADIRWTKLWSTLGLFRSVGSEAKDGDPAKKVGGLSVDHDRVASLYRSVYRIDDDPKWIRESYYHQLLSLDGNAKALSEGVGRYYYDELVASADYHFVKSRNFQGALDLYTQANGIRPLRQTSEMRRASCLVRLGNKDLGEKTYRDLLEHYPSHQGIKTSHVDAVLFRHEFEDAKRILNMYGLVQDSEWIEWQWGRVYLGLDEYIKAIAHLQRIVNLPDADSHYFVHLARALDAAGDFEGALRTLGVAQKHFPNDVGIASSLGGLLERNLMADEAKSILTPLFAKYEDNVHAAYSLVRIATREGSLVSAKEIIRRARKGSPAYLLHLVVCAQAEVDIAGGRPELALNRLEKLGDTEAVIIWTKVEALRAQLTLANVDQREKNVRSRFEVPSRYKGNARIQIGEARLAFALRDKLRLRRALDNLAATRIDRTVLDALKADLSLD